MDAKEVNFGADDAALLVGRLMIENFVLRRGLDEQMKKIADLEQTVKDELERSRRGPTIAVVERAQENDASTAGEP